MDLDIHSRVALTGLVRALGTRVNVLFVGGGRRRFEAHLELARSYPGLSPDDTIVGLVRLIQGLPPAQRRVWAAAQRREFNVGVQAAVEPFAFELRLKPRTLKAMTDVGGALVFTVYAPETPRLAPQPTPRKPRAIKP